jgi:hypothetical protein
LRERDHLEDTGVDERIMLIWFLRKLEDWFELAKDRGRWRALVNAVCTLGFHEVRGIS